MQSNTDKRRPDQANIFYVALNASNHETFAKERIFVTPTNGAGLKEAS